MFCTNCGAKLTDGVRFCPNCGAKQGELEKISNWKEEKPEVLKSAGMAGENAGKTERKKLGKGVYIVLAVFLAAAAAIGTAGYIRHAEKAKKQEQLAELMGDAEDIRQWSEAQKVKVEDWVLGSEEEMHLKEYLDKADTFDGEDYDGMIAYVSEVDAYEEEVLGRLKEIYEKRVQDMEAASPEYASGAEKEKLEELKASARQYLSDGKYRDLEGLSPQWQDALEKASQKKTGYQVTLVQQDFTEYPKVRLYLDVRDANSGEVVKEISPNMFYVSEKMANDGEFLKRQVDKAVLLNENERLNINMLADTSGSMEGQSLASAKGIMRAFLDTVQFAAGDQVKMTQFNSEIDKSQVFTGDRNLLYDTINCYDAYGQTKLYDSIIYGVQDVSGQEGAKCVIAFTDGMDVGSYNTAEDTVNMVSRYQIPVFIVRIGDQSMAQEDIWLQRIAEASGGAFKNLAQFSSDLNDFYNEIYRQMKEYYVVEYEAGTTKNVMEDTDVSVYIQNEDMGGEAAASINPGNELFDTLLGRYLRSYITDMNNHNYNQLAEYVDSNVAEDDHTSIQWQMRKQVTGGFSNVAEEALMDYSVTNVEVIDENTVHISANENYDALYDEVYGELCAKSTEVAKDAVQYIKNAGYEGLDSGTQVHIWARVNQVPQYELKRGQDGKWRFSKYVGDISLGEKRQIYDVEVEDGF